MLKIAKVRNNSAPTEESATCDDISGQNSLSVDGRLETSSTEILEIPKTALKPVDVGRQDVHHVAFVNRLGD